MAIWQDLVSADGFSGGYQTRTAIRSQTSRISSGPKPSGSSLTVAGEECQVDYGTGPMVRDPRKRQVSTDAVVRDDTGLQPQIGSLTGLPFQYTHVGRTA